MPFQCFAAVLCGPRQGRVSEGLCCCFCHLQASTEVEDNAASTPSCLLALYSLPKCCCIPKAQDVRATAGVIHLSGLSGWLIAVLQAHTLAEDLC